MNDKTTKPETAAEVLAEMRNSAWPYAENWADRIERALSAQGEAVAAYRLRTGAPRTRWQWMDGKPSAGAIQEAELHGWEIEYAYTHPAPARVTEWTDDQCIAFACVAFRHAPKNLPKGVELNDIRMGAIAAVRSALEADHG